MDLHVRVAVALVLTASSCLVEAPIEPLGREVATVRTAASAPFDGEDELVLTLEHTGKRPHASKTLAALALERVTGRKPDPMRLMQ